jgi:hypothetical protein
MNWVCTVARWLNNNSAAVMAIATVVIAWASWTSSRLVRLQKKIERANRMPVLTLAEEQMHDHRSLHIKNIGYGPALNIVRKVVEPGGLLPATAKEPLPLGSLAPGEKICAFVATLPPNASVPILDDPKFHVVIECDDVLDSHYEFVFQNRTHSAPTPIAKRKMPPTEAHRI